MDLSEPTDNELVAAIAGGQTLALAELVRRHQEKAVSLAGRLLGSHEGAEDVAQEAFLRVLRAAGSFRREAKVSTWLYRIVLNLCRDRLRRKVRSAGPLTDEIPAGSTRDPAEAMEAGDVSARVKQAIDRLPDRQRTAIMLHRFQSLSHDEIGAVTGWSVSAIESLLVRAYQQLRSELSDLR